MKPSMLFAALGVLFSMMMRVQGLEPGNLVAAIPPAHTEAAVDKRVHAILAALNLPDEATVIQVQNILLGHLNNLEAWHELHDREIKPLWNQFNKAHGKGMDKEAQAALDKIDQAYGSLKAEHEAFLQKLSQALSSSQVETVKDVLTVYKVRVTDHAYGQIFHGLTPGQNAFILDRLKAAREQAMDAGAMAEKSAFFKKYKVQIEAYLTAQGYDVKKAYKDFVAGQKADLQGGKPATEAKAMHGQGEIPPVSKTGGQP